MNRYCLQVDATHAVTLPESLEFLRVDLEQGLRTEDELAEAILAAGDDDLLPELYCFLQDLRVQAALRYNAYSEGQLLGVIEPLNGTVRLQDNNGESTHLSRFAYLRHDAGGAVLDCPESGARIRLEAPAVAEISEAMRTGVVNPGPVRDLLLAAGYLEPERQSDNRAVWEFHDLLFHNASRIGRPWGSIGATWRFEGRLVQPPLCKPPMSADVIALRGTGAVDGSFSEVLGKRRSVRISKKVLTVTELSTLLYHVFQLKETYTEGMMQTAHRAFPSGGGIHELECYVWIRECDGLDAGLYHYQANAHALARLDAQEHQRAAIFAFGRSAWGSHYPAPQVVLTLAARFPRIAVKYERMAYRAVLLNAGCAMQTVYLVATAMGVAVCGLGNSAPQIFAEATGLSPLEETSVAEIALSGEV